MSNKFSRNRNLLKPPALCHPPPGTPIVPPPIGAPTLQAQILVHTPFSPLLKQLSAMIPSKDEIIGEHYRFTHSHIFNEEYVFVDFTLNFATWPHPYDLFCTFWNFKPGPPEDIIFDNQVPEAFTPFRTRQHHSMLTPWNIYYYFFLTIGEKLSEAYYSITS